MADVNPVHPAGGPGRADPSQKPKKGGHVQGASFDEALEAASGAKSAGAPAPAPEAGEAQGLPPAYLGPMAGGPAARESVLRASEKFLQLVELFQAQLSSPEASLKDIAPLLRELELHREKMLEEISALSEGDPGRRLLEEMAVMVSTESAKFHRGDYV